MLITAYLLNIFFTVVAVNDTEISSLKYQEMDSVLDLRYRNSYYSADFKDLTMSDPEGSVYEEIRQDHGEVDDENTQFNNDTVYLEVIA